MRDAEISSIGKALLSVKVLSPFKVSKDAADKIAEENYFDKATALKDCDKYYYKGYSGFNADTIKIILTEYYRQLYKSKSVEDWEIRKVLCYIDSVSDAALWWKQQTDWAVLGSLFEQVVYSTD